MYVCSFLAVLVSPIIVLALTTTPARIRYCINCNTLWSALSCRYEDGFDQLSPTSFTLTLTLSLAHAVDVDESKSESKVVINVSYPPDYPSLSPPNVKLEIFGASASASTILGRAEQVAEWTHLLEKLYSEKTQESSEGKGEVVLFEWISQLTEE